MPLPCSNEIFSSSVICFSTISARSSGERFLFIQGKSCFLGAFWARAVPSTSSDTIACTMTGLQNLLFIRMATSEAEFTNQHSSGEGQKRRRKSVF